MKNNVVGIVISYWAFVLGGLIMGSVFSVFSTTKGFFVFLVLLTALFILLQIFRSKRKQSK